MKLMDLDMEQLGIPEQEYRLDIFTFYGYPLFPKIFLSACISNFSQYRVLLFIFCFLTLQILTLAVRSRCLLANLCVFVKIFQILESPFKLQSLKEVSHFLQKVRISVLLTIVSLIIIYYT